MQKATLYYSICGLLLSLMTGSAVAAAVKPVVLAVGVNGNGRVLVTAAGRTQYCTASARNCQYSFPAGTAVSLKADAALGYGFSGWVGACTTAQPACSLNLVNGSNVTAQFEVKAPVTATMALNRELITPYGSALLTWSSTNAQRCVASGSWNGSVATSGEVKLQPGQVGTYAFTLTCIGGQGTASASATLRVAPATLAQRIFAAQMTARNTDPASSCRPIADKASDPQAGFYWEVGDANGVVTDPATGQTASGSVSPPGVSEPRYTRDTSMLIASASKWVYGTYFTEVAGWVNNGIGTMPAAYVPFLNFTSGYTNFKVGSCANDITVGRCMNIFGNDAQTAAHIGKFDYDGGHLQVLGGGGDAALQADKFYMANLNNFPLKPDALTQKMYNAMAAKVPAFVPSFHTTELAGGAAMSAANYAEMLKGLVRKDNPLKMAAFLQPAGTDPYAVCTSPTDPACGPDKAVHAPVPASESWHYGLAHWIEDDPVVGDGSYSSAGWFGFYPWVDASKTYYGIIARKNLTTLQGNGYSSVVCGRAIRKAFMTGEIQK